MANIGSNSLTSIDINQPSCLLFNRSGSSEVMDLSFRNAVDHSTQPTTQPPRILQDLGVAGYERLRQGEFDGLAQRFYELYVSDPAAPGDTVPYSREASRNMLDGFYALRQGREEGLLARREKFYDERPLDVGKIYEYDRLIHDVDGVILRVMDTDFEALSRDEAAVICLQIASLAEQMHDTIPPTNESEIAVATRELQ